MKTVRKLSVFALGVVGAFGLGASAGTVLGPIDAGATASHPANIPEPTTSVEVDGYTVKLSGDQVVGESTLIFDVLLGGESVTTDPYMGAAGHLVIIRTGDLEYLHAYPIDGMGGSSVHFVAEFPTPGTYRLFFDFAHAGRVHTAAFTVEIMAMADMPDNQEGG